MQLAVVNGDTVIGVRGDIPSIEAPPEFADVPIARLRYDGEALVDIKGVGRFAIGPDRVKHLPGTVGSESYPILDCRWDDVISMVDGQPVVVPKSDVLTARLAAYAADKRWRIETGGIVVNGAAIDTSRDSQAMISGAFAYSQANPDKLIKFKAATGWTTLDAATVAAIATAVGDHVQACFAVEEEVAAAIEAGTITSIEQIDAADWPLSQ